MPDGNCVFCKIASGELSAAKVFEDDYVTAFNDLSPQAPVHVLIIPKAHLSSTNEITAENAGFLPFAFLAAKKIASLLGVGESGYRLIVNCGADAGQTVFHWHMHLLGGAAFDEGLV